MSSMSQSPDPSRDRVETHAAVPGARRTGILNCMSVDVEEHFQVQAFASCVDRSDWDSHQSRVERNTDRILGIFDEAGVKSTFFTLGWVAERHPDLIRRIVAGGHELASHGYSHVLIHSQSPDEFRDDVRRTKSILEDIGGVQVRGYRAATFSLDKRCLWAHDILAEEGYFYSSSIFPVKRDNYGMPDAPRTAYRAGESKNLIEVPLTTVRALGRNLAYFSGGGFFRLIPYSVSRAAFTPCEQQRSRTVHFLFPSLGDRSRTAANSAGGMEIEIPPLRESRRHGEQDPRGPARLLLGTDGRGLPRRASGRQRQRQSLELTGVS